MKHNQNFAFYPSNRYWECRHGWIHICYGEIFYTCPKCGSEYLATLITEDDGEVMCIY